VTRAGKYRTRGIDGAPSPFEGIGEDAYVENLETSDIQTQYTRYDQYASNDHLPHSVDTPYGLDTGYPTEHAAADVHTPPADRGPGPRQAIDRQVEQQLHDYREPTVTTPRGLSRWFVRAVPLPLPASGLYAASQLLPHDPRRYRVRLAVASTADKPVWFSHEEPNSSAIPGPNVVPLTPGGAYVDIVSTNEVWVIADPAAATAPWVYVIVETKR